MIMTFDKGFLLSTLCAVFPLIPMTIYKVSAVTNPTCQVTNEAHRVTELVFGPPGGVRDEAEFKPTLLTTSLRLLSELL